MDSSQQLSDRAFIITPATPIKSEPHYERKKIPLNQGATKKGLRKAESPPRIIRPEPESPVRTGRRKRGQTSIYQPSTSGSSIVLNADGGLRPYYAGSTVSLRSEMTLGILDYYLHEAGSESELADPALQNFNFDLTPTKEQSKTSSDDDGITLPSHRTNFLRKAFIPKSKKNRRRSSLSICCQGEGILEQCSVPSTVPELTSSQTMNSSPISPRNFTGSSTNSSTGSQWHRRDSVASIDWQNRVSTVRVSTKELPASPISSRPSTGRSTRAASNSVGTQSSPGSSFDFVRSVRRRPRPLQESPPPLKLRRQRLSNLGRRFASCVRRVFSRRSHSALPG